MKNESNLCTYENFELQPCQNCTDAQDALLFMFRRLCKMLQLHLQAIVSKQHSTEHTHSVDTTSKGTFLKHEVLTLNWRVPNCSNLLTSFHNSHWCCTNIGFWPLRKMQKSFWAPKIYPTIWILSMLSSSFRLSKKHYNSRQHHATSLPETTTSCLVSSTTSSEVTVSRL